MVELAPDVGGALRVLFVAFVCQRQGYGVESVAGAQPIVGTWYVRSGEVEGKRWSPLV